jgi:hypothetical protein
MYVTIPEFRKCGGERSVVNADEMRSEARKRLPRVLGGDGAPHFQARSPGMVVRHQRKLHGSGPLERNACPR